MHLKVNYNNTYIKQTKTIIGEKTMALITTLYTIGWFGVSGEDCTSFDLREKLGTYVITEGQKVYSGPYTEGSAEWDAVNSIRISSFSQGAGFIWSLEQEKNAFGRDGVTPDRGGIKFDKIECGRMYMIKNPAILEFEIPNFVPSAQDVDMGRVVAS